MKKLTEDDRELAANTMANAALSLRQARRWWEKYAGPCNSHCEESICFNHRMSKMIDELHACRDLFIEDKEP